MEGLRALGLSRVEQAFMLLLRAGLWQRDVEETTLFPLTADEWEEVYQCALQQTVQGIVFEGMNRLPEPLLPPDALRWTWMAAVGSVEEGFQQATTAASASQALLTDAGADIILQKGLSVACFYDKPERRVNGDIDWYVRRPSALSELVSDISATSPLFHADGSYSFFLEDTEIELHPQLADLQSARAKKVVEELLEQEGTRQLTLANGATVTVSGATTTLLMLTSHILKHLTTVGIGLRQFCDLARAYVALHGHYDVHHLEEVYRRAGLRRWTDLQHHLLVDVLATPVTVLPSFFTHKDLHRLLRDIMRGGNFGQHTAAWQAQAEKGGSTTWHTVRQILQRLPFTLRYAPREGFLTTYTLIKNKYNTI